MVTQVLVLLFYAKVVCVSGLYSRSIFEIHFYVGMTNNNLTIHGIDGEPHKHMPLTSN